MVVDPHSLGATSKTNPAAERAQALAKLDAQVWDLVIIGGGISGAGVAQQAARQGWSVLLIEQRDFAWGTSSRSSKLVHGGLRYLKEGDLKTTLHSVRERERLLREAPELIEPQSFLFAQCSGRKPGRWLFQLGLKIYDLMAGTRSRGWAKLDAVKMLAPGLAPAHLRGALLFQDAKTDDARLVWRVLSEAQRDGAVTLNYVAATALQLDANRAANTGDAQVVIAGSTHNPAPPTARTADQVRHDKHPCASSCAMTVQDVLTGQQFQVRAKAVINATGAWADRLRAAVAGKPMLRPLRGSHLIVPFWRLPVAQCISLMHPRDGRPVFLYPWEGATLIGTTDLDHRENVDVEASITQAEVDYLIEAANDQFPAAALCAADVIACYAGVRPVVDDGAQHASKAAREHVVLDESGLITLTGGKLTTFRLMAQDALRLAAKHNGQPFENLDAAIFTPVGDLNPRWRAAVRHRLAARYGYRAGELSAQAAEADLQTIPGTNTLWLELSIAAQCEAVLHLDDLLLRRTRLGLLLPRGALDHLPRIRSLCEPHLRWSESQWQTEIARYRALIAAHYSLPNSMPPDAGRTSASRASSDGAALGYHP